MTFITRLLDNTFQNAPAEYFSSHALCLSFLQNIVQKISYRSHEPNLTPFYHDSSPQI